MKSSFGIKQYIGDAVFCIMITVILTIICIAFTGGDGNKEVRILQDGKEIAVYDLSDSASLYVDGVHIKIRDGRAVIYDSDCPDKVCMSMHGVDKNGGGSVCIPNRIVLEPVSGKGGADAIAG